MSCRAWFVWQRAMCCVTAGTALAGCENAYPEVVVVNDIGEQVLIKEVSFNGCYWGDVLAHGEVTSPQRCLPGADRVRFKKLDLEKYCAKVPDAGGSACDGGPAEACTPSSSTSTEPLWFSYQTVADHEADLGEFRRIEVHVGDLEQDFSVSGPYGH